ncbi:DUF975 family protein, partial [Streptococcus danieliae]|nr:DUF975 family protein [Streptococcus danieliae]
MNHTELKNQAKNRLSGNWTWAVILTLLTFTLPSMLAFLTSGFGGILAIFFTASRQMTFLNLLDQEKEEDILTAVFTSFRQGRFVPVLITGLLQYLFLILWSLLFVIPGFIKIYSYSMTNYIIEDLVS